MLSMTPGQKLARGRRAAQFTTIKLAALLGCTPSTITHMERNRRRPGLLLASRLEALSAAWPDGPIRAADWAGVTNARGEAEAA